MQDTSGWLILQHINQNQAVYNEVWVFWIFQMDILTRLLQACPLGQYILHQKSDEYSDFWCKIAFYMNSKIDRFPLGLIR
jgi:hypothetical protein